MRAKQMCCLITAESRSNIRRVNYIQAHPHLPDGLLICLLLICRLLLLSLLLRVCLGTRFVFQFFGYFRFSNHPAREEFVRCFTLIVLWMSVLELYPFLAVPYVGLQPAAALVACLAHTHFKRKAH